MSSSPSSAPVKIEKFSLPLFLLTVLGTLGGLFAALRWLAPRVWAEQVNGSFARNVAVFLIVSFVTCILEYFFHRYVLHLPAIPFLRRLYRQHTLHHALTHIARKPSKGGGGILFIENKFPIVEVEQGEASFFPWYSLAVFAVVLTPLFALLQWLFPLLPWFTAGWVTLSVSLCLYELLHALNHWPFEKWLPLIEHPRWGKFWRPVYGFHLRHHAVIDCNESISGFLGLPLADWLFGTCVIPQTLYAQGETWNPEHFRSPKPRAFISALDRWAEGVVRQRRLAEQGRAIPGRVFTRGENIANWVTHGLGLAVSVAGLTLLIVFSRWQGDVWPVIRSTLFGFTLLVLSGILFLRQTQRDERGKRLYRKLAYASVAMLMAGSIFALGPLVVQAPTGGFWLLLGGALCYGIGVIFYRWQRLRYHRTVWHTFVLGGSTCHILAVLLFVAR